MSLREKMRNWRAGVSALSHSQSGKNVLLYLLFVIVAFLFWMLLSLDNVVQRDFDVPLELQDVPDSVVVINDPPAIISVSVKAKGSQLVRYLLGGRLSPLKIKYSEYRTGHHEIFVSHNKLEGRLREYFGNGSQIISFRPDSIKVLYSTSHGRRVPVVIDADLSPSRQCVINGPLMVSHDSVTVYAVGDVPRDLRSVTTEPIVHSNLTDTVSYYVRITPIANMRIIPDVITVTVPVEPLISKRVPVKVEAVNVPVGVSMVVFPSKVDVSYLVPMSAFSDNFHIVAYANYDDIRDGASKIPLTLSLTSDLIRSVSLTPDSVEYIIQR